MGIQISVPGPVERCDIELDDGEILYVLGANGTGKSALVHHLNSVHSNTALWIPSHRRTSLQSGGSNLTSAQKPQLETHLHNLSVQPTARWLDQDPDIRVNLAIFNLIQKRSQLSQEIADAFREGDEKQGHTLIKDNEDPLVALSGLLRNANLLFEFRVDTDAVITATKSESQPFSVAEMSDGERNALLLAAEVLTAQPGTLILIDEPELHLHRSIVVPLLSGLFSKRLDCMFVVSTHELTLPLDDAVSKILLVRNCHYQGSSAVSWDVDLVNSLLEIDEDLKTDVLGARRSVVFVEGDRNSLDMPLYSLILPSTSVIPRGARKSVEDAVRSIRASTTLHWVKAYGIVDRDDRHADVEQLRQEGIYPIEVYSVESIYYDRKVREELARKRSSLTGADPSSRLVPAVDKAIKAIRNNYQHLAKLAAERKIREEILAHLPNSKMSALDKPIHIDLDVPGILQKEYQTLLKLINDNDLDTIIRRYPIKRTSAPDHISKELGFDDETEYAKAVIQLLKDDEDMLRYVRQLIAPLDSDIFSDS